MVKTVLELTEMNIDQLWEVRNSSTDELEALNETLSTNKGREGKTQEQLSDMLARQYELQNFVRNCNLQILHKQGRLK